MNNAGFESGLIDWTLFQGTESITNDAFAGSNALALSTNGSGVDQSFSVVADETYTLSTYGKTSADAWSGVGLRFYDAQWNELDGAETQINSSDWTEYTVDAIAPTGAVNGVLWAWKGGDTGTTTLDEFGVSGATPPPPTTDNLLTNPSFEFSTTSWNAFTGTEGIATDAVDGSQSLELSTSSSGVNQTVDITPGETYQLTAQIKSDNNGWNGIGLRFRDSDGNPLLTEQSRITNGNWSLYDIESTAPDNAARAEIFIWNGGDSGSTLLDDVSLAAVSTTPVNQPPTITSNGGSETASLTFEENGVGAIANINATDPDGNTEGNGLSYTLEGPDISQISINPTTGELNFNTSPDFENPIDNNEDNQYEVDVVVTDMQGGRDRQSLSIAVTDVDETPPAQYTYNGKTYQLTSGTKSWQEAQYEAEALGGHLVAINSAAEQQWLRDTFGQSERFWIGLTDEATEGQFQWTNGEPVTYTHWSPNEPNDYKFGGAFPAGEDYGLMNWNAAGQWNDAPDSYLALWRGIIELPNALPNAIQGNSGRIEAENATLGGSASTNTNHTGFSGESFVDGFTQQGAATTFTINVAEGGLYNTTLRYSNGPNGPSNNGTKALSVYVNGVDVTQTQLTSTGTWKTWDNKAEMLTLNPGENTISYRYDSDDTGWVNLDYMWIAKAVGNGPIGTPITSGDLSIELEKIAQLPNDSVGGRARMIGMTTQEQRLFVYEERDGHIYELTDGANGTKNTSLFFDVGAAVFANTGRNLNLANLAHGGLKGVAFPPDFSNNGKFYTSIMEDRPSNSSQFTYLSDVSNPIQADSVVVEWTYNFQLNQVNANSYREVVRIGMPVFDHPIKEIVFNRYAQPDDQDYGLLYITHGDGSVQSATAGGGLKNDALGKVLRINPLQNGAEAYSVPSSNPFVGNSSMLDEVYSLGHRNPHTISFAQDAQGTSHILVGEAGRDNIEEINLITAGGNYGWSEREGTFVHRPEGGGIVEGLEPLSEDEANNGYVYPAAQWGHAGSIGAGFVGQAVAGGYVGLPGSDLAGQYLFGDFAVSGQLYHSSFSQLLDAVTTLDPNDPSRDNPSELTQANIGKVNILFDHDNNDSTPALSRANMKDVLDDEPTYVPSRADIRFGQGPDGEIYVLNKRNSYVYRVNSSIA